MRKISLIGLCFTLLVSVIFSAGNNEDTSQSYPEKPIQMIVPASPGGDTDSNCRLLSKYLEAELGQKVVTVNVTGAGGTLGSRKVKDAPPDGYTVLFYHPNILLNKGLGLVDYNFHEFKVSAVAVLDKTSVFVVNSKSSFNTIDQVVAKLKKDNKSVSFATEIGAYTHLHVLATQEAGGGDFEFNIVDVGTASAKIAALMGEQIDVIGVQYGLVKDYVKNGDFKVLGVLSNTRNPGFPEVPTFAELGIDAAFTKFFYYSFPAETPDEIITTFSAAVEKVVNNPEYQKEAFDALFVTPTYMDPADALSFLKEEEVKYDKYLAGITK